MTRGGYTIWWDGYNSTILRTDDPPNDYTEDHDNKVFGSLAEAKRVLARSIRANLRCWREASARLRAFRADNVPR